MTMRARTLGLGLWFAATLPACGPPAAPTTATVKIRDGAASARSAGPADSRDRAFTFVAAAMPPDLAIDGDAGEWKTAGARGAARAVLVAIDDKKLALAVTVPNPSKGSVALALSSYIPPLPEVGWTQRGGSTHELTDERCRFEQVSLPEAYWKDGAPQPPEVVEACRAVLKRHAEMAAKYSERFVRRFRVSAKGIEALDAAGQVSAIAGAKLRAGKGTIEVELPLAAMPHVAEAPLKAVRIAAAEGALPADLAPPTKEKLTHWTELPLASPASFGAYGQLLAAIYANRAKSNASLDELSYHPAKPETIDTVSPAGGVAIGGKTAPDRTVVVESSHQLFTKTDDFGEVVIGIARAHDQFLATYKKGKLVGFEPFPDVRGTKKHGDALHVFAYDSAGFTWRVGTYVPPHWRVLAVKPDGTLHEMADEGVDYVGMYNAWDDDPTAFSEPDFKSFGVKGKRSKRPKTVTWRWDEKEAKYVSKVTPPNQAATGY